MIHFIKGELVDIGADFVVIENGGMGYKVSTSLESISQWQMKSGEIMAHTEMIVREDAISLVGFATKEELHMFQLLTSVSGVGTKVGVATLSALSVERLSLAIQTGDVKTITGAPGVGKKTAERLVLELKDKVKSFVTLSGESLGSENEHSVGGFPSQEGSEDALMALIALGYTKMEAQKALSKIDVYQKNTEAILKEALRALMMQ